MEHTIPVKLTETLTIDVTFGWNSDDPYYWEHKKATPENDDADFLEVFLNKRDVMEIIDAEISRWTAEYRGTRYGDPMDLARERALEESA